VTPSSTRVILAPDSVGSDTLRSAIYGVEGFTSGSPSAAQMRAGRAPVAARRDADTPVVTHEELVDWFTLATCPIWLGNLKSGFSRSAALYSLARDVFSSIGTGFADIHSSPFMHDDAGA